MLTSLWLHVKTKFTSAAQRKVIILFAVIFVVMIGTLAVVRPVHAFDIIGIALDSLARGISYVLLAIASFLGKLLVVIIDVLLDIVQYNGFSDAPAIVQGWVVIRDACNMFFVLVLLVIAFGTILRIENYKFNRLLAKLVLMAILINFSKLIASFFIDIAQVVLLTFANAFHDSAYANFTSILKLQNMLEILPNTTTEAGGNVDVQISGPSNWDLITIPLFAIIMLIFAIMVMIAIVVVFLIRIIALWILVVLSPLAYLTSVLPASAKYSSQWWQTFGKWVTTGPIIAFFLWLSLAVLPQGNNLLLTPEQQAASSQTQQVTEAGDTSIISAGITGVSSSANILGFMLSVTMLVISLSVASTLGGAAGSFAGRMATRLQGIGSKSLQIAGAPFKGAKDLAAYGVKSAGRRIGRAMRESKYEGINMLTPEYWKGWQKRAERLSEAAKTQVAGKGEYRVEKFFKGEKYATDRKEMARWSVINANISDINKELGPAGDQRQAVVEQARKAFGESGQAGENLRAAHLVRAAGRGNEDDMFSGFGELYYNDKEFRNDLVQHFTKSGYGESDLDEMFANMDGINSAKFMSGYVGLHRKYLGASGLSDAEQAALSDKDREKLDKEARASALKASDVDQERMGTLAAASEAAKETGHWEQFVATKDVKSGRYYMMGKAEREEEVIGEARKIGIRDFLRKVAPHTFLRRTWQAARDEHGNLVEADKDAQGNYIGPGHDVDAAHGGVAGKKYKYTYAPDNYAPEEGTLEHAHFTKLLGAQHIAELRQMQSRNPDQLIMRYFDNLGNFVEDEEEAISRGFTKTFDAQGNVKRTAVQNLKADFERMRLDQAPVVEAMYKWKFFKKPDATVTPTEMPWNENVYKQKVEPGETDRYYRALTNMINYPDIEANAQSHGIDTAGTVNVRPMVEIKELLHNTDYAARKGMANREEVLELASKQQKVVRWDKKRIVPGQDATVNTLKQNVVQYDTEIKDFNKQLANPKLSDADKKRLQTDRAGKVQDKKNAEEQIAELTGYWEAGTEQVAQEMTNVLRDEQTKKISGELEKKVVTLEDANGLTIQGRYEQRANGEADAEIARREATEGALNNSEKEKIRKEAKDRNEDLATQEIGRIVQELLDIGGPAPAGPAAGPTAGGPTSTGPTVGGPTSTGPTAGPGAGGPVGPSAGGPTPGTPPPFGPSAGTPPPPPPPPPPTGGTTGGGAAQPKPKPGPTAGSGGGSTQTSRGTEGASRTGQPEDPSSLDGRTMYQKEMDKEFEQLMKANNRAEVNSAMTPRTREVALRHILAEVDDRIKTGQEFKVKDPNKRIGAKSVASTVGIGQTLTAVMQKIALAESGQLLSGDEIQTMPIADYLKKYFKYDLAADKRRAPELRRTTNILDGYEPIPTPQPKQPTAKSQEPASSVRPKERATGQTTVKSTAKAPETGVAPTPEAPAEGEELAPEGEAPLEQTDVAKSVQEMTVVAHRMEQAMTSTSGSLEEYQKMVGDMSKNLGDFVKAIDDFRQKFGDKMSESEKKAAESLSNMYRGAQGRATNGMGTTDAVQQRELIWQLMQLNKALRESGRRSASQVLNKVVDSLEQRAPKPETPPPPPEES